MTYALQNSTPMHFYPRPPRGGRPEKTQRWKPFCRFLSTPSARRATVERAKKPDLTYISIHALREEGDLRQAFQVQKYFISIHALREEGDSTRWLSSA